MDPSSSVACCSSWSCTATCSITTTDQIHSTLYYTLALQVGYNHCTIRVHVCTVIHVVLSYLLYCMYSVYNPCTCTAKHVLTFYHEECIFILLPCTVRSFLLHPPLVEQCRQLYCSTLYHHSQLSQTRQFHCNPLPHYKTFYSAVTCSINIHGRYTYIFI